MKTSALLVNICLGAAAQFALADGPPPAPAPDAINEAQAACNSDIQALCAGVQPGGGRILACLKEHKDKVSDPCKVAIVKATQTPPAPSPNAINEAQAACNPDIQALCASVQPGGGRILACLKEHKDKVSDSCKVAIVKATQPPPPN
jgi:D-serine deaminase-like pyridoxal phosphate-dependent protein